MPVYQMQIGHHPSPMVGQMQTPDLKHSVVQNQMLAPGQRADRMLTVDRKQRACRRIDCLALKADRNLVLNWQQRVVQMATVAKVAKADRKPTALGWEPDWFCPLQYRSDSDVH